MVFKLLNLLANKNSDKKQFDTVRLKLKDPYERENLSIYSKVY